MSLAILCQDSFSHATRQKGREYFQAHYVDIVNDDQQHSVAIVANGHGEEYGVRLQFTELGGTAVIRADCACPHFSEGKLCKHIWATLLSLDKGGQHRLAGQGSQVQVIHDPNFGDDADDGDLDSYDDDDDDFFFDDDQEEDGPMIRGPFRPARSGDMFDQLRQMLPSNLLGQMPSRAQPRAPNWQQQLQSVRDGLVESIGRRHIRPGKYYRGRREVWYALCIEESDKSGVLTIAFRQREERSTGGFGKIKELRVSERDVDEFSFPEDRALLELLLGDAAAREEIDPYDGYGYRSYYERLRGGKQGTCQLLPLLYEQLVPQICATGRCGWLTRATSSGDELQPLVWDDGPPWKLRLKLAPTDGGKAFLIEGELRRGDEAVSLVQPRVLLPDGLVVFADRIARLEVDEHYSWIDPLRKTGPIKVPKKDRDKLLSQLWLLPTLPDVEWPAQLQLEQIRAEPKPRVSFFPAKGRDAGKLFVAKVSMDYEGQTVEPHLESAGLVDAKQKCVRLRNPEKERAFMARLEELGFKSQRYPYDTNDYSLPQKKFPKVAAELIRSGCHVEAEGIAIRRPGTYKMSVVSAVDWFELEGEFDFDGVKAPLPELLAALKRGEQFITLGDGTQGMLPEEWLARYGALAEMATVEGDKLRFKPSQAMLLDALLASQPHVEVDAQFEQVRQKLRTFAGVQPGQPPQTFSGTLREYQTQGLGWLHFLRDFHFGGCLADDMGLGKTVQVLALLEARRTRTLAKSETRRPSLAVVPRSLVYNWIEEAKRFTPELRVLDFTGLLRREYAEKFDEYDLVITTYGTLRRDVVQLKEFHFDYAILDESQAIKNSTSQSAKACRLVQADHRLAMTGTPIENHLGELWSLFEFLNPGMLGRSAALKLLASGKVDDGSRQVLAQALRPFMLRRTKGQVLKELPQKTEQTLYCELETKQRKLYDELRDHYRAQLTQSIEKLGLNKSKIHVLEALLRLRQAACHPGLIDKKKAKEPSAKLETLLEQLDEVLSEGHKVLVFSQFTSLLDIVRTALGERKIPFEYLDGQTRDRQARVEHFQSDPACCVFLISLKAGGQGLNLTAADYVFILDPWWNPAAEAQAVDRAHRIGQDRPVFAYRLIARNTVEEKILELQRSKRQLADAIISEDNSLISELTADDLQMLLS